MWGLWGSWCCPCPGFCNTLQDFYEFLDIICLKVCQCFEADARGGHRGILCCLDLVSDVPGIFRWERGWR